MFRGWENFFYIIGSAAGALIVLMFAVITLTAGEVSLNYSDSLLFHGGNKGSIPVQDANILKGRIDRSNVQTHPSPQQEPLTI